MLRLVAIAVVVLAGSSVSEAGELDAYRTHLLTDPAPAPTDGAVRVTFLGAATLLFDDGETQLLTDGFFTRPSLRKVLSGGIETDAKVVKESLKRAKVERLKAVFVAHSHYDHALDVASVANITGATVHGSESTLNIARGGDAKKAQLVRFEAGKEYKVGRFTVLVRPGKHSPPLPGVNDDLGKTIDQPLRQPASFREFKEGGAFDFVIRHGDHTMVVNAAANAVPGGLKDIRADVLFLSCGALGLQDRDFQTGFYAQTVKLVRPRLVIPVHWDSFFAPLSDQLPPMGDTPAAFDFLIEQLKTDRIRFGILQGYQSITLFGPDATREK